MIHKIPFEKMSVTDPGVPAAESWQVPGGPLPLEILEGPLNEGIHSRLGRHRSSTGAGAWRPPALPKDCCFGLQGGCLHLCVDQRVQLEFPAGSDATIGAWNDRPN